MNGIVLYQSKYGATKKYVDWLTEATKFSCLEIKKADIKDLAKYDIVILAGGIYASGIAGLAFLKKHIMQLENKRIAVFCVGASPFDEQAFKQVYEHNFSGNLTFLVFMVVVRGTRKRCHSLTEQCAKCSKKWLRRKIPQHMSRGKKR